MKKRILPLLLTLVMVLSLLPAPALAAETTSDPLEGSAIGTAEPEPTSPTEPEPTSPTEPEPTSPT